MVQYDNNNIGIILPDLKSNQLSFMAINEINRLIDLDLEKKKDYSIFFEQIGLPCIRPKCGIFNISHISNFNGTIISTNLLSSEIMIASTNNSKKIFYVWDLEWLRNKKDYIYNLSVYRNVKLVTRSNEYANLISKYANVQKPKVVEHFNIEEIIND